MAADPTRNFRPDIEGLRGVAILMVVAFHCGLPALPGGFIGVDVFFVLSGYLITGLLVAEIERTGHIRLVQFYARRVRRLLPASALMVLFTLAAAALLLAPGEIDLTSRAARATAVYMSNLFFAGNAADYFAPDIETNPLLHTWTLAVEEQFYLFWPVLILLGLKLLKSMKALLAVLGLLTLLSFALCVWQTAHAGVYAFYGLPARAWEFALGGLAALVPGTLVRLPAAAWLGLGWLGALTILSCGLLLSSDVGFPGWIALAPVVGAVLLLSAGARQPGRGVAGFLALRPLRFLGAVSYSWYLWHWPFLVFAAALMPGITVAGKFLVAAAALAVATLAYRFYENPIRFAPRLTRHAGLSLGLGAAITIVSLAAATVTLDIGHGLAAEPSLKAITASAEDLGRPPPACVSLAEEREVKTCSFGDETSPVSLVLFGDSHAMQWFSPLQQVARTHGWRLVTFVKSGCPSTDIAPPDTSGFRAACAAWRAGAMRDIVALHPTLVVLGNSTGVLAGVHRPASRLDLSLGEWQAANRRTFRSFNRAGLRVLSIRDAPRPSFFVPTCLARATRHAWYPAGSCVMQRAQSENLPAYQAQLAAASGIGGISFMDLTDAMCSGTICPVRRGDMIMYRDDNHFTGTFARSLAPLVDARLKQLL